MLYNCGKLKKKRKKFYAPSIRVHENHYMTLDKYIARVTRIIIIIIIIIIRYWTGVKLIERNA